MGLAEAMGSLATGAIALLFQGQRPSFGETPTAFTVHEAIIPFKEDRDRCETSGRTWVNDQCRDTGHDPSF